MIYIRASVRSVRAAYVRIRHSCVRPRFDCVPEVRPSLRVVLSPGGCTVTACTRPYRHFRHPRASTSLQLDGSNWTTNGRVVIRTRHLSATPFASYLSLSLSPYFSFLLFAFLHLPPKPLPNLSPDTGVSRDDIFHARTRSSYSFPILIFDPTLRRNE